MQIQEPKGGYKLLKLNKYSKIIAAEYPEDWSFIPLGNPSSGVFSNGINKDKEDYGSGCLFVNILDVFREFTIDPKKLGRVKVSDEEITNYRLEEGDIILDRSSNIFETVGYPAYFAGFEQPVVFSGFTFRYRPNKAMWDSKFLTYQLMSYPIRKLVISISTKSANSNVNQHSYKKICIPHPQMDEQRKIRSIVSSVDSLIQQTQKIIEQTQRLKKGLMQKLLTKGIGHTKFKKVKWYYRKHIDIPEEWEVLNGEELFDLSSGVSPSEIIFDTVGDTLYVQVDDMNSEENEREILNSKLKFNLGDNPKVPIENKTSIVFPKRGAAISTNKVRILSKQSAVDTNVMCLKCKEVLDTYFMFYTLLNVKLQNFMENAGVPQLNNKDLYPRYFVKPPLNEQRKIAAILSAVDTTIEKQLSYRQRLENLKKGLMQKLLTGEIRVKV